MTLVDDKANTFNTIHATVLMPSMDVSGHDPITGVGDLGNILASSFEIKDKGTHFIFYGGAQQLKVTVDRAKKNEKK